MPFTIVIADIELSISYPYRGVEGKNSLGVRQKRFPRESKTKTAFPRGSGQVFQRGDDG